MLKNHLREVVIIVRKKEFWNIFVLVKQLPIAVDHVRIKIKVLIGIDALLMHNLIKNNNNCV